MHVHGDPAVHVMLVLSRGCHAQLREDLQVFVCVVSHRVLLMVLLASDVMAMQRGDASFPALTGCCTVIVFSTFVEGNCRL